MVDDANRDESMAAVELVSSTPHVSEMRRHLRAMNYAIDMLSWRPRIRPPLTQDEQSQQRLIERLSPEQHTQLLTTGHVDTYGSTRCDRYRILPGSLAGNIIRHRDLMRFCIAPGDPEYYYSTPPERRTEWTPYLVMLCQFVLLTLDEPQFLRTANALGPLHSMPPPW